MRFISKVVVLTLFVFSALGCQQEFEDISSTASYAGLIGQEFVTTQPLLLYAITIDQNYAKIVHHYAIMNAPGISGPEVILSDEVFTGASITVEKALRCSNCWFGAPTILLIELQDERLEDGVPVYLYGLRLEDDEGRVMLDSDFFVQR